MGVVQVLNIKIESCAPHNLSEPHAGVFIGSRVAPVLSNIFLGKVDVNLEEVLGSKVVCVARYVDDYLVSVPRKHQ